MAMYLDGHGVSVLWSKMKEYVYECCCKNGIKNLVDGKADGSLRSINSLAEESYPSGTALGANAVAFGLKTEASGKESHAEGNRAKARGASAHAEGQTTIASGTASHAEGRYSGAEGLASHAEGIRSIAKHRSQHVFGEFNVEDPSTAIATNRGTYVEIVGNGTDEDNMSNARVLDWSGNEALAGTLTLGMGTADEVTLSASQLKQLIALLSQTN